MDSPLFFWSVWLVEVQTKMWLSGCLFSHYRPLDWHIIICWGGKLKNLLALKILPSRDMHFPVWTGNVPCKGLDFPFVSAHLGNFGFWDLPGLKPETPIFSRFFNFFLPHVVCCGEDFCGSPTLLLSLFIMFYFLNYVTLPDFCILAASYLW